MTILKGSPGKSFNDRLNVCRKFSVRTQDVERPEFILVFSSFYLIFSYIIFLVLILGSLEPYLWPTFNSHEDICIMCFLSWPHITVYFLFTPSSNCRCSWFLYACINASDPLENKVNKKIWDLYLKGFGIPGAF